ncbi:acylneuraminate cytidylyltransferase family protein [Candidatus Parcubacteria bacterium]|nr:acylneuraminate cytidylyltransferase family protein [Candidatus Parcubacteria bacterium]MCG2694419.1 acylneuraminate cytidylyltransferase family protein [Candidatus Parcubacteria bacterium]
MNDANNNPRCLGFIPARSGSKRVPNKNIRMLDGHPLLAYSISSALKSGVFSRVIVSTESEEIAEIAKKYGAEVPFLRPAEYAADKSQDIEWVKHLITELKRSGEDAECFSILRPTSPLRQSETIRRAWAQFLSGEKVDSLRAVEKCSQHPMKMWRIDDNLMNPIFENPNKTETPWHCMPYQSLPEIYVQNASLEIAWCDVPLTKGNIAGDKIMSFITKESEGFDINFPEDWLVLEQIINSNLVKLPEIK